MANFRFKKAHIEITNVCNLKCSFCPRLARDDKFMSVETFIKVLSEVKDQAEWICLHLMGEPTAHPQFAEIVRLCHQAGKKIYLVTNGILLDRHQELFLGQGYFHQVNISLQSYWDNFPEKDIKPYLSKLFRFSEQLMKNDPMTYLNFRFWDGGIASVKSEQALDLILQQYGMGLSAQELRSHEKFDQSKKRFRLQGRHLIHFDQRFLWPSLQNPNYGEKGFCQALKTHLGILVDGTVVPCCLDSEGALALGSLKDQGLSQVLAGARAQNIRQGFAQNERRETFCQHCDFVKRFEPGQSTL